MAKAERIEPSMTLCPKYRAALTAVGLAISVAMSVATPAELFAQATPQGSPTTADPPAVAAPQVTPAPSSPAPAVEQSTRPWPDVVLKLPRDLSPWGMFMAADVVVKAVMVGLAFASVLTWTIWFAKAIELMLARRRMRSAIEKLAHAKSWSEANVRTKGRDVGVAAMLRATDTERRMSADAHSASGIKERIASR